MSYAYTATKDEAMRLSTHDELTKLAKGTKQDIAKRASAEIARRRQNKLAKKAARNGG